MSPYFLIGESESQQRLDMALASRPDVSSRSQAQRIIRQGLVSLDGDLCRLPKQSVKPGASIQYELPQAEPLKPEPTPHALDILFEDEHLLVLDKPAGMVSHPACGHWTDTLVNYLLYHCELSGGETVRPGLVHRLDKDTSGLMVVAKNEASHADLTRQFSERSIGRLYKALVWGRPPTASGIINEPLGRHPKNRKKWAARPNGKEARTRYRLLRDFDGISLIECRLETGRTHQIRVHMTHLGCPLVGDPLYGKPRFKKSLDLGEIRQAIQQLEGQALHAGQLDFDHPFSKERLKFKTEPHQAMLDLIKLLEKRILKEPLSKSP